MSAPLSTRLPNKNVYNFTLQSLFVQIFVLSLTVFVSLNQNYVTDIVNNTFLSCKIIAGFLMVSNIYFGTRLAQMQSSSSNTGSNVAKIFNVLRGAGALVLSTIVFHCIAVLYGAPFFESVGETFHFAIILSVTAVLPPLCVLGTNFASWIRVYAQNRPELGPESVVQIITVVSIIGAWLGAFPIPLDWDRPWQVWPITCVLGALIGHILGLTGGMTHLFIGYRRLKKFKLT